MPDRRIYIHEGSFRDLCGDFPHWRAATVESLALALVNRMAQHHLIDNGEKLGLVAGGTFGPLVAHLDHDALRRVSTVFRSLVFAPADVASNDEVRALLGGPERVVATCWDAGYFTFATGATASAIMFRETGSLRALRAEVHTAPHLHPDLTIISGRRLYPFSAAHGLGPGSRRHYDTSRSDTSRAGAQPSTDDGPAVDAVVARVLARLAEPLAPFGAGSVEGKLAAQLIEAARTAVGRLAVRVAGDTRAHA